MNISFMLGMLSIIVAGGINASFATPLKHIKHLNVNFIWFSYSIFSVVLPWLFLALLAPQTFSIYLSLPLGFFGLVLVGGLMFGVGQACFAEGLMRLGIALSFVINLGLSVIIGSFYEIVMRKLWFNPVGLKIGGAIFLIATALYCYYQTSAARQTPSPESPANLPATSLAAKKNLQGWFFVIIAGLSSGIQNITFITLVQRYGVFFTASHQYGIWPPFLAMAGIAMAVSFAIKIKTASLPWSTQILEIKKISNLLLLMLMALLATGSLVLYSVGISHFTPTQKIIGWPAFMISIILASQAWGLIRHEISFFNNHGWLLTGILLLLSALLLLGSLHHSL